MFTLVLPHFLRASHETLPPLDTPTLNQWLRFGRFHAQPHTISTVYQHHLGNIRLPENSALAVPIWQQLGINTTQLLDARHFAISTDEAETLIGDLNRFYSGDAQFHAIEPQIWYMTLPQITDWYIPSVLDSNGQTDGILRSEHHAAPQWLQLSTEIQMFLHDHPINRMRQQNGEVPINGLWLWQPESRNTSVFQTALIGSDSAWTTFSKHAHTDLPYDLAAWQRACDKHGTTLSQTLLFSEAFAICAYTEDVFAYQTALQEWEKRFFVPLEHALQTGILPALELVCEHGTLTVHHQRHAFWRRKKTFDGKSLN